MKRAWSGVLVAVAVVFMASGCGLRYRVDRDLLDPIPPEDKLILFEAENDVLIAKDERRAAQACQEDNEAALDRAEAEADIITTRADHEKNRKVATLLRKWAKHKIAWREAEIELCEAREDSASAMLMAARARYEKAKAVIVKERTPGAATSISLSDFDSQAKSYEEDAKDELKDTEKVRSERDAKQKAYDDVSRELQAISGGAYGGPWAD